MSTPDLLITDRFRRFVEVFDRVEWNARGRDAHVECPHPEHAHTGNGTGSLHLTLKGSKVALQDFGGTCTDDNRSIEALLAAKGLTMRHLFLDAQTYPDLPGPSTVKADAEPSKGSKRPKTFRTKYIYTDEAGEALFEVRRYTYDDTGEKTFRQFRPDGTPGIEGVRRVLYRLHAWHQKTKRKTLIAVEGEKDVESLVPLGLPATCNMGGAGNWKPEYVEQIIAAGIETMKIIPDNDKAGEEHALTVATARHAAGLKVYVVALPGLAPGGDVTDWLAIEGNTKEKLIEILKAAPEWAPPAPEPPPASEQPAEGEPKKIVVGDTVSDVAFAMILADEASGSIRYCEVQACWYVFDGTRWLQGSANLVKPHLHRLAHKLDTLVVDEPDSKVRDNLRRAASRLESHRIIMNVISQAMALRLLQIDPTRFDRNPDLLNTPSGTINLRTGELRAHDPEDFLSLVTAVPYVPGARSPLWEQTVRLAMQSDEMAAFLQRVCGYILSGRQSEKRFFDEYGPHDSGKTSVNDALSVALGPDYAKPLRIEALQATREPEKIPHELAGLMGRRIALVSEVPPGTPLNEALIKRISGGDPISVAFKYGRAFEYHPQFTIVMYSNDRVQLSSTDDALWTRATSIPFTFDFKASAHHDADAKETLKQVEHLQAVLAWAVEGARVWYQQGLAPIPEQVTEDSAAHRAAVGAVGNFITEECESGPGHKVAVQVFHRAFQRWAKAARHGALSREALIVEMERLGHRVQTISTNRHSVDGFVGVEPIPEGGRASIGGA